MAGEVMESAPEGRTPKLAAVKRVRRLFPETWIWLEYNARYSQSRARLILIYLLERISIECPKTNTKVINAANHNKHELPDEPVRTRSKYMLPAPSAGKRVRASPNWFKYYFRLVEKVARDFKPITECSKAKLK